MTKAKIVKFLISTVLLITLFIGGYYGSRLIFRVIHVKTGSMEFTIMPGDRVIGTRVYFKSQLKTGEVIAFVPNKQFVNDQDDYFVKRLIGLPGDLVNIVDGKLFINGKEIKQPGIIPDDYSGTFVVPKGQYFVLGDNRGNSFDSRFWNYPYIKYSQIKYIGDFVLESGESTAVSKSWDTPNKDTDSPFNSVIRKLGWN